MSEEVHSKRSGLGSQCKELGQRQGSELDNRQAGDQQEIGN